MPAEKRNHFLDIDESDDDGSQGYDSEAEQQLRKGASKRRKLNQDDGTDEDELLSDDEDLEDGDDDGDGHDDEEEREGKKPRQDREKPKNKDKSTPRDPSDLPDPSRQLTKKNLVATEKAVKRSGVIYISRVPPFSTSPFLFLSFFPRIPPAHPSAPLESPLTRVPFFSSHSETRHDTIDIRALRQDQQSLPDPRGLAGPGAAAQAGPEPEEELQRGLAGVRAEARRQGRRRAAQRHDAGRDRHGEEGELLSRRYLEVRNLPGPRGSPTSFPTAVD